MGPLALSQALSADDPAGDGQDRVHFGAKRSGLPFTPEEVALLERAAAYVGDALRLAERQRSQVRSLEALTRDAAAHESEAHQLQDAMAAPDDDAAGLHVYGLGSFRVERSGAPIRSWGGAKAGSRQAEAIFAFLYDRGPRGVAKDEFLELIWPDVPVERADLAFHRTLNGLRRTLEPGWRRGSGSGAITFHNDRYHLDPQLIAWSDLEAFKDLLADARRATETEQSLALLEQARALYRGEYLDDCPFYGDSAEVEGRRELVRGQFVDLLIMLGERYEKLADRSSAAGAYREALLVHGEDLVSASAGLARLGGAR
jgi:two-component SAPR family response regulator